MLRATIRELVLQGGTQDGTQELSDNIYDKIKDNPNITIDELAVSLNVGRRTIARHLKQMSDRIHYVGGGYSGHWEVITPREIKAKPTNSPRQAPTLAVAFLLPQPPRFSSKSRCHSTFLPLPTHLHIATIPPRTHP